MVSNIRVRDEIDYLFSNDELIAETPSQLEARALVTIFGNSLAASAYRFNRKRAVIRFRDGDRPYRIPAKLVNGGGPVTGTIVATPEIAISEMMISAPFLRVLAEMMERPEDRATIVRVSDERQIVVSASMAPLITSATPAEATRRRREDYWHLPDLEEFRRDWRQHLEPNNPDSTREITFACCDPVTRDNWMSLTNRYRAIEMNGEIYHYSVNVGSEAIAAPAN